MKTLGGMFQHIKESQMSKSYDKVMERYEKSSQYYQSTEIKEPQIRKYDIIVPKMHPRKLDPQLAKGASTSYYLFRSTPKNFISRRLYLRKQQSAVFKELWRNAYQAFQLIYMELKIQKRQEKEIEHCSRRRKVRHSITGVTPRQKSSTPSISTHKQK